MNHTKEEFEEAAINSYSIADMCRFFNLKPNGGNYRIMHNAIKKYCLDINHFRGQGWNVGLNFRPNKKKELSEILTENSYYQSFKLKNRLFEEHIKEKRCENCGLTKWNGNDIPLELHHINGDNSDNRIENLMILCPNCHAQTKNYRGRNIECIKRNL